MNTIFQDFLSMQAIVRFFSVMAALLLLAACDVEDSMATGEASDTPPAGVNLRIDVGELSQQLPETALLYAFARVPGERMPLIVEYFAVNHVPAEIPFIFPSQVPEVEVVVRIAPLGQVQRGPQDLEVITKAIVQHPPLTIDVSMPTATAAVVGTAPLVAAAD